MAFTTTRKLIGIGIASLALLSSAASGVAVAVGDNTPSRAGSSAKPAIKAAADCPSGWFCVWSGRNYTGRMQKVQYDNSDLTQYSVFNGHVLSYYNHGQSCDVTIYSGKNYAGDSYTVERGAKGTAPSGRSAIAIRSDKWVNCR
ncbi:peptidase inhibitor family I36 protein [Streptomyces sp. NPDC046759]|uniref:peptidase inhibitor family I36 protein n=1 Tax=Streptomyces sp. NPDC046759 TaxID=3155019 RepID=UPI0033D28DC1